MFVLGVATMLLSMISLWFMLPGVVLYFAGADMIARSNDLHAYYEYKIKNK